MIKSRHFAPSGAWWRRIATLVAVVALLISFDAAAQSVELLDDRTWGGYVAGISADGTVVVGQTATQNSTTRLYRWQEGEEIQFFDQASLRNVWGVSADGVTAVGVLFDDRWEAFRHSESTGFVALGVLPGKAASEASDASANGAVIVGTSNLEGIRDTEVFRWTSQTGMVSIGVPADDVYFDRHPQVSDDGTTIVGTLRHHGDGRPEAYTWTQPDGIVVLPALPGDVFSQATGISADGQTIVGHSWEATPTKPVIWDRTGNVSKIEVAPGFVQPGNLEVSGDGSVIVGIATYGGVNQAFVWTAATGMRTLASLVGQDSAIEGLPTAGVVLSADGRILAGTAWSGQTRLFRAILQGGLSVQAPAQDVLIAAGEITTLQWSRPDSNTTVDVYLLPDTLGTPPVRLDFFVDVDTLQWTPPETLFSRSARIRIFDSQDSTIADTSDFFRIKPYHLTRLSADSSRYIPFVTSFDGWSIPNQRDYLFPASWWQQDQFKYVFGIDPFTQVTYDTDLWKPPISGKPSVFPDWPATVRAYGTDAAYWAIVEGVSAIYKDSFQVRWSQMHRGDDWGGSCYGLAVSSLLSFMFPEAFNAAHPNIGSLAQDYTPSSFPDKAREVINSYYTYQFSGAGNANFFDRYKQSPSTMLTQVEKMLLDGTADDASTLSIFDVQTCNPWHPNGGHAIVPYRLVEVSPTRKWLYVYDSNHPGDDTKYIVIDTDLETWFYADIGAAGWGGSCGMFLNTPISNDLNQPTTTSSSLSNGKNGQGPGVAETVVVHASGESATIAATDGSGSVGYSNGLMFNSLDEAIPLVPAVGGPALPVGYQVPAATYDVSLSGAADSAVSAVFVGDALIYSYSRLDNDVGGTDVVSFSPDDGLLLRNDEASATKLIAMRAIVLDETSERTIEATDVQLSGADSVRFAASGELGQERMMVVNAGGAKSYNVRLREASSAGEQVFEHVAIAISSGATHTVRAAWDSLRTGRVTLDIDEDSDGTTDSSIELVNQVSIEIDDVAGTPLVEAATLLASYPNPFSVQTTIPFVLTEPTDVQITVHDVLGREVARIADGHFATGRLEATIDGRDLASGLYIVRMDAGGIVSTRTVLVAR